MQWLSFFARPAVRLRIGRRGLNEGTMVFELTENDTPVGGTQEFVFDTPRSYTIKAENVVSATTERPEGWVVKTNLRDRQCIIEPPMAAYLDGNESGSIVFTLTSPAGRTANYTVAVAAAEIRLDFAFENPGETKFAYASTRSYEFTANESFGGFDFQLPAGWTGSYKKGETSFTITSPGEDDEGAVLSGDLSVTPLSVRGQRGVTATFRGTAVDAHDPAMTLETDNVRFQFETPVEIGYTGQYVADIVVADKPEGWEVTPDVAGKKITITAPDADNHTAYGGQVTLKTYNELGDDDFAQTYTIDVRLDGIARCGRGRSLPQGLRRLPDGQKSCGALPLYAERRDRAAGRHRFRFEEQSLPARLQEPDFREHP